MDEQAIRLLLKEHADALNAELHGQIAALTRELQAAKLVGHNRHGGDAAIPRSMRLEVPKFNGTDSESWIFAIQEYFDLLDTTNEQRLKIVGFNLEGDAAEWFRWMSRNKFIISWDGFLESVRNWFGPCKYEDPQGALSKLLQTGTVAQYQSEFEKLMNRVTDIAEPLLISFYISGLKPSLQRELLISKPSCLGDAFSLARVTEARLDDHGSPSVGNTASGSGSSPTLKTTTSRSSATQQATAKPPCYKHQQPLNLAHHRLQSNGSRLQNGRSALARACVSTVTTNG